MNDTSNHIPMLPFTVSIDEAKTQTEYWRKAHPDAPRAFLIPAGDLLDCMKEIGIIEYKEDNNCFVVTDPRSKDLRVYMAKRGEDSPRTDDRLFIVGTEKDDYGVYRDIVEGEKTLSGQLYGSGVFDFTTPCPSECDSDSPLNK